MACVTVGAKGFQSLVFLSGISFPLFLYFIQLFRIEYKPHNYTLTIEKYSLDITKITQLSIIILIKYKKC